MAWFKRRQKSEYQPMVFATDEAAARHRRRVAEAGLTFRYVEKQGPNTYYTYEGSDPEKAKEFLRKEPVTNDQTYIVVVTPDGTWGTDSNSLYLEKLRPWQLETADADCTGSVVSLIDGFHNVTLAARGVVDNFLVQVSCGRCRCEWIDGIRFDTVTLVRCPNCHSANRVDSGEVTEALRLYDSDT